MGESLLASHLECLLVVAGARVTLIILSQLLLSDGFVAQRPKQVNATSDSCFPHIWYAVIYCSLWGSSVKHPVSGLQLWIQMAKWDFGAGDLRSLCLC